MSNLQISLAVAGVVLLCLIFAYNTWSNRRHAPRRPDRTASIRQRIDPGESRAAPASASGVDITSGHTAAPDPLLSEPAAAAAAPALPPLAVTGDLFPDLGVESPGGTPHDDPLPERRWGLDPSVDAIISLRLDVPVTGETALLVQPATRRAGSKPFGIEGRNAANGLWEDLCAGHSYTELQAGVQLANRTGAINDVELAEFTDKVRQFAERIGACIRALPEATAEIARARELDQFASEHDAQLGFSIRAHSAAWSPGYIEQHAGAAGFTRTAMPGRMQLPSDILGNNALLALTFDVHTGAAAAVGEPGGPCAEADSDRAGLAVHEINLSLDVPQVPRSENPFARLCQAAQQLCASMDGVLCDHNGNPLPPQVLESIGADLHALYDTLDARGVSAGSALARRLFS